MSRDELIAALRARAEEEPKIVALLLGGSLGAGTGDAYSDADLIVVVNAADHAAFVENLRAWVEVIVVPVHWRQIYPGAPLFNAITSDWIRFDITVTIPGRVTGAQAGVRPLVDRGGVWSALPPTLPPQPMAPGALEALVIEFLRVMGLLAVGAGRGEWVLGVTGVGLLRGQLIELMIAQTEPPLRPGALRLQRILPAADVAALTALPALIAEPQSVIAGNLAVAALFLPRAKALAREIGAVWPQAFEDATRAHLRREMGLELP